MLKIVGMIVIFAGTGLGLCRWRLNRRLRQQHLEEFAFFLQRAEFAMGKEQTPLAEFFCSYCCSDELLCQCLCEAAAALQENSYPDGQLAWQAVFGQHETDWNLPGEEWECVLQSGRAFFGRSRKELGRLLAAYRLRVEQYYAEEKLAFAKQQKVVIPVGMLSSMMLILILL